MKKNLLVDSIFPAGSGFNLNSYDVEEMQEQAVFWSFEHNQLGQGEFVGNTFAYHTRNLQLSLTSRSVGFSINCFQVNLCLLKDSNVQGLSF